MRERFTGKANEYLAEIAKDGKYTDANRGYVIIPHKIKRCLGLSLYEKMLLECLLSYMGDSNKCYPTQERLALHMSCSSKTVERHLKSLKAKEFIEIEKPNKNNVYYLPNNLHENPYLLLSEKTYEFMNSVRGKVNSGDLDKWVAEVVESETYQEFITKLRNTLRIKYTQESSGVNVLEIALSGYSKHDYVEKKVGEILEEYKSFMQKEFEEKFKQTSCSIDLKSVQDTNKRESLLK
ncbi:helix-turn-helix domain-containing protein [Tepidibacillus sp. LV47]|uniref:helix-turn-helix domain-containing protein n=1 Tax=Tepidibacillus sp. LV47 TaxID=3398228 RepID=UPI003AAAA71A